MPPDLPYQQTVAVCSLVVQIGDPSPRERNILGEADRLAALSWETVPTGGVTYRGLEEAEGQPGGLFTVMII